LFLPVANAQGAITLASNNNTSFGNITLTWSGSSGISAYPIFKMVFMWPLLSEYDTTIERLNSIKKQLDECVDESESGKIILSIPGIGVMNASALLAAIDKGQAFNNPKEFAVWLGLTPKQHASGNISKMGGIIKRGDRYLRKQLVHGARSVVSRAAKKTDTLSLWATKLRVTKPFNKVAVAVAHRLARLIWILLTR
jgi:transposase